MQSQRDRIFEKLTLSVFLKLAGAVPSKSSPNISIISPNISSSISSRYLVSISID